MEEENTKKNGAPEEVKNKEIALEEAQVLENYEISLSYVHKGYKWDQSDIFINNIFVFQLALNIIRNDEDQNHKMWKNVEIEMIDQNRKKLRK